MDPDKCVTPEAKRFILSVETRGFKKGLIEGFAHGLSAGVVHGVRDALLALLRARGIPASAKDEARIRASSDAATLDGWIARASTASSVREVLGPTPAAPAARRRSAKRVRPSNASRG